MILFSSFKTLFSIVEVLKCFLDLLKSAARLLTIFIAKFFFTAFSDKLDVTLHTCEIRSYCLQNLVKHLCLSSRPFLALRSVLGCFWNFIWGSSMSDLFGNIAKNVINRDNLCSRKCDRVKYFIAFDGWLGAPGFGFVE